jgi:hypothetical protein
MANERHQVQTVSQPYAMEFAAMECDLLVHWNKAIKRSWRRVRRHRYDGQSTCSAL